MQSPQNLINLTTILDSYSFKKLLAHYCYSLWFPSYTGIIIMIFCVMIAINYIV